VTPGDDLKRLRRQPLTLRQLPQRTHQSQSGTYAIAHLSHNTRPAEHSRVPPTAGSAVLEGWGTAEVLGVRQSAPMANSSSLKKVAIHSDGWSLGNNGIEIGVDGDKGHLGDLIVKKAGIVWCPGKTAVANGTNVRWEDLRLLLESSDTLQTALIAVRDME